ncbi:MAG: EAL domain-containing protein [Candidatus Dormibacteria bacterium]
MSRQSVPPSSGAMRARPRKQAPADFTTALLESVSDLVFTCDERGTVTSWNSEPRRFLGLRQRTYPVSDWERLTRVFDRGGRELGADERPAHRVLRGEEVHDLELFVQVGDEVRAVSVSGRPCLDAAGHRAALVVLRDITDQRRAEAERDFAASHDALTGLPNRALFVESLHAALQRAGGGAGWVAVLYLDIDHFHVACAGLGHQAAQRALAEMVARIEAVLRASGRWPDHVAAPAPVLSRLRLPGGDAPAAATAMARVGSDEFLILCEQIPGEATVSAIVDRVQRALGQPLEIDGSSMAVTASIGASLAAGGGIDPDALISQAEVAMHRARSAGQGNHAFFTADGGRDERRQADIQALGRAAGRGELHLLYQPQLSLPDERLVGVEALLRWQHPERGAIPPLDFIPLAEETGLIVPIGRWVLEEACRQGARWHEQHPHDPPLRVSVNVAVRQLESELAGTVATALRDSGLRPDLLCLEITESGLMRDLDSAIAALEAVKALGVRISVDDFGTGYSSLAYLKRLPVDELKVDRAFVDGLGSDPDDTAIVAAVVASAHALGLSVVAEGVETAENVASLVRLGCEVAQGFHYSKPVPAEAIDAMLAPGEAQTAGTPVAGGERVLVVDDAADVRQLVRLSLVALGFDVREAGDGRTALALARAFQPTCVVLDRNLPDLPGLEVCRSLREVAATRDCTVVMLTAQAHPDDKAEAFSLGVDEYIVKPVSPRDLASRVQSAMRQRATLARAH